MSSRSTSASASTSASRAAAALAACVMLAAADPAQPPAPPAQQQPAPGQQPAPQPGQPAAAPEAEGPTATDAPELAQALEAAFFGNSTEAARLAYVATTKIKRGAEKRESAELLLAESLDKIGLTQAAAEYYLGVAAERQNLALLPRALRGLDALARRDLLDEDQLLRGVLAEAELASIPADVADFLHFHRGLSNLREGFRRWSDHELVRVTPKSYYGRKTALVLAVAQLKDGQTDKALEAVERLVEDPDLEPALQIEARLTRARLYYELGKLDEAIEAYKQLGSTGPAAGEALLERAWAHYRRGEPHDAMGLLYALGAPQFRKLPLPDQYVLRGLIYQRFCHFRAAKRAVADFHARFGPGVLALENGTRPEQVEEVVRTADRSPDVRPARAVLDAVAAEQKKKADLRTALELGGLSAHLDQLYALLDERAHARYARDVEAGAARAAERLLDANEQANLLEYEVGVSIFRKVKTVEAGVRAPTEVVPKSGERVYYPFDGEYWSDELSSMRFIIRDRCVE